MASSSGSANARQKFLLFALHTVGRRNGQSLRGAHCPRNASAFLDRFLDRRGRAIVAEARHPNTL